MAPNEAHMLKEQGTHYGFPLNRRRSNGFGQRAFGGSAWLQCLRVNLSAASLTPYHDIATAALLLQYAGSIRVSVGTTLLRYVGIVLSTGDVKVLLGENVDAPTGAFGDS